MLDLEERIEGLLYDKGSEDEEDKGQDMVDKGKDMVDKGRDIADKEEEDLKSILSAVDLSWERIGLMERRGFKVISI